MIFVTGGAAQGKLAWALQHSGYGLSQVTDRLEEEAPIFQNLEEIVREALDRGEDPMELLPRLADREYVLCREVGCGLVSMDPGDRAWREAVGRLSCRLAQEAQGVVRLWCGLPVWLKGGES